MANFRRHFSTRKLGLAGGVSIAVLALTPQCAFAQATVAADAAAADVPTGDNEIIVTSLKASLQSAQKIKRDSDTVQDSITAEDIGALPDRSVNEALQRVPGVAISRFAAPNDSQHFSVEGSGVTIRGLSYVRSEFNGRDTFAVNGGREIGFNDVPTELVGSVDVFKNTTADLIEGGISGSVSINARKPFDSKDQLIYLSGSVNYGDFAKRASPSGVALISKQWELGNGGRFGVLASASFQQQYLRSDSVFIASPFPRYNDDKNGNGTQDPGEGRVINAGTPFQSTIFDTFPVPAGFDRVYVPTGAGSRTQDFDRKRTGYSGALQYENASGSLLVTAQFLRAESTEAWLEHTIEPNVYYGDVTATFPAPGTSYTYDKNGVFTSGTLTHTGGTVFANQPAGCIIPNNGNPYTTTYCPQNQLVAGGQFTTFSNRYFYTRSVTQDQSLNIKWNPSDRLRLSFDGQYVNSNAQKHDDIVDTATYSQVNVDLLNGIPRITPVTPGFDPAQYFANPNAIYFRDAFNDRQINDGEEWAFKVDGQYDLSDEGFLRKVRAGARYSDRKQTVRDNDYNNWGSVSDTWTGGGPTYFSRLQPGDQTLYSYNNFFRGDAVRPPSATYIPDAVLKDHDALMALLRRATALGGSSYTPLEDRGTDLIDGFFRPGEIYRNSEKAWAGYVRLDFATQETSGGMRLSGNIGGRFVRTEDRSVGGLTFPAASQVLPVDNNQDANGNPLPPRYTTIAGYCAFTAQQQAANPSPGQVTPPICTITPEQQAAALAFANGASVPDTANQSYTKFLPSLNLRLEVTPKFQMRFAASKAISRPDFGALRNFVGFSPSGSNSTGNFGFSAQARNPFLKPIDANQFDLTAEWYFAKVGSLTGSLFYKDLSNIIVDNSSYVRTVTNNGSTFPIIVNGPANASGHANIKGVEVAYQQTFDFLPGALRGFGTQLTFTYINAGKIPNGNPANAPNDGNRPPQDVAGLYDNLPLTGLSKYNANASVFYDLGGFYARVAYSWRSKFLLTNRDCCFPFLPVYSLSTGQMDGSVFYTVNKQFKIGLEVQNLLDTTTKTTFLLNGKGLEAPRSFFKSDRSFQLSVRLTL